MITPINLLDLDRQGLEAFFAELGEKPFRASQLMKWVHQLGVTDWDAMTNLSKALRQRLREHCSLHIPAQIAEQTAGDGTRKWLLELDSGNRIETVFIPEAERNTLCVSSQVGCALDCSFCATAHQGFNRNLSTAEIIAQLWLAEHSLRGATTQERQISNVVLMGMGEPLLNFDNVVRALRIMLDDFAYGLSKRRITLSTAGVIPAMDKLREQCPVSLAVSLHAPDDELRNELVPLNKKYPLHELMAACRRYTSGEQRRRITFEYVLLKGVNDSPAHARALIKRLRGLPAKVNLIPFNPFPATRYQRSDPKTIDAFRELLMGANLLTVTRRTRGDDIAAACGQLAGQVADRSRRAQRMQARGTTLPGQEKIS